MSFVSCAKFNELAADVAALEAAAGSGLAAATTDETAAGTSSSKAVTPAGLAGALSATGTGTPNAMQQAVGNAVESAVAGDAGLQSAIASAVKDDVAAAIAADASASAALAAGLADDLGATTAETLAGTVGDKFVSPADLKAALQETADYPITVGANITSNGGDIRVIKAGGSRVVMANTQNSVVLRADESGTSAKLVIEVDAGNAVASVDRTGSAEFAGSVTAGANQQTVMKGFGAKQAFVGAAPLDGSVLLGHVSGTVGTGFAGIAVNGTTGVVNNSSARDGSIVLTLPAQSVSPDSLILLNGSVRVATGSGHATATLFAVDGAATVSGAVSATAFNTTSDERSKEDIVEIDKAKAAKFRAGLRWVTYKRKDDGGYAAGLIAQEVLELTKKLGAFEFVVTGSDEAGYALDYGSIYAILAASV